MQRLRDIFSWNKKNTKEEVREDMENKIPEEKGFESEPAMKDAIIKPTLTEGKTKGGNGALANKAGDGKRPNSPPPSPTPTKKKAKKIKPKRKQRKRSIELMSTRGRKPDVYKYLKTNNMFPLPLREKAGYIFPFTTKKDTLSISDVNVRFATYGRKIPNVTFVLNILDEHNNILSANPIRILGVKDNEDIDITINAAELIAGSYKMEIRDVKVGDKGLFAIYIDKTAKGKFGINGKGFDGKLIGQIK